MRPKFTHVTWTVAILLAAAFTLPSIVGSQQLSNLKKYIVGKEKSGYVYATPQTRAIQDDDFSNPAFLAVDQGKKLWSQVEGTKGKSCESCHGAAESSMKNIAASYPKWVPRLGKVVDIEQRINEMRTNAMGAPAYKWESPQLLAMTTYVKLQSRGAPVRVATNGPAHVVWLTGEHLYKMRRGQLDMSCQMCHVLNTDRKLRSETISQGQTNGFPTYRLKWQSVGSVQRRFQGCNKKVRATPYPYGSDENVALELYVASRGEGLPVETPAVRK